MTQAKIMREAAERRAAKSKSRNYSANNSEVDLDAYAAVDGAWVEIGLSAPARRALIDEGLYKVSDLRKYSLDAIKEGRTVIIISHSLSQILDSDKIYVMKKGEVAESGSHDELISMNGTYREIFDASARSLNLDKLMSSYREN